MAEGSGEPSRKKARKVVKKCFNDPVHGQILLHPLLVKFIDTPQFQRLRKIKQLGGNYFVYPGASHNRFEHSIGTCHLAGRFARHLQSNHIELDITDEDVLCVEIAGLCHDLGHGPYSHMFDHPFLPEAAKQSAKIFGEKDVNKDNFRHEDRSKLMLERLIQENGLQGEMEENYLDFEKDKKFIKQLIDPEIPKNNEVWQEDKLGRSEKKSFLFEIVSNKLSGVDVDKWDYFARDCHHLGIKSSFDHNRFLLLTKVLKSGAGRNTICVRDKECKNLYEMFHTRCALHRRAYQHRISTAAERMICDAMLLADQHIKFKGDGNRHLRISETVNDMEAFEKLTDSVVDIILCSAVEDKGKLNREEVQKKKQEDIDKANIILKRIYHRDLYIYIGKKMMPAEKMPATQKAYEKWEETEKENFAKKVLQQGLDANDYCLCLKKFDYGKKDKNPVDPVDKIPVDLNPLNPVNFYWFYTKKEPDTARKLGQDEESFMLPKIFMECHIEVFCKDKQNKDVLGKCFEDWSTKTS